MNSEKLHLLHLLLLVFANVDFIHKSADCFILLLWIIKWIYKTFTLQIFHKLYYLQLQSNFVGKDLFELCQRNERILHGLPSSHLWKYRDTDDLEAICKRQSHHESHFWINLCRMTHLDRLRSHCHFLRSYSIDLRTLWEYHQHFFDRYIFAGHNHAVFFRNLLGDQQQAAPQFLPNLSLGQVIL